jgi:hypothetical protein
MTGLWTLSACLIRWGVGEELWVDGSFLTEKIDPKDADLVLVLAENFENVATDEQLGVWDWWDDAADEPKLMFRCHTFSVPKIPIGDPDHQVYLDQEAHWRKFFGTSREGQAKGIVRILLPDGCV